MKENKELTFRERFLLAQSSVKSIDKDGKNPHFKSAYTTLPHALEQILPHLQANKLIYRTELNNNKLTTIIEDVYSEQLYKTEFDLLNIVDMQKLGSAITYAQRYGLLSIMGLASGIDDDGNDASEKRNTEQIIKSQALTKETKVTHKEQIENDMLLDKFKSIMIDYKEMFTEDELSIYRTYYSNKEYEKIKGTIKLIETRVMKG
jgi:hypothetical protein